MKTLRFVLVIICMALISMGAVMLLYSQTKIIESRNIPFNVSVENRVVGFVAEATMPLQFGTVPPGSGAKRWVNLTNNKEFPVSILVKGFGEAGRWIQQTEKVIEPGKTEKYELNILVPEDAASGDYNGTIKVYVIKK